MNIPTEAIEAAARGMFADSGVQPSWDEVSDDLREVWRRYARDALEAALPFLVPKPSVDEVERVAIAVFKSCCPSKPPESFYSLPEQAQNNWRREAAAAIAAMNRAPHEDQLKRANRIIGWMMPYIGTMCPPPNGLYDLNLHYIENDIPDPPETTKSAPLNQRAVLPIPQPREGIERTYDDGLRRAAEIMSSRLADRSHANAILSELGHPPQPSRDDTIECEVCHVNSRAPVAPACYSEKCPRRLQHDGPSREELLAALRDIAEGNVPPGFLTPVYAGESRASFQERLAGWCQEHARAIIAQADNAGNEP